MSDRVEVYVDRIVHETDEAILIEYDGEEVWLPLSQVSEIHRSQTSPSVVVARWLAMDKGMI